MSIDLGSACREIFRTEKKWMTILGISVSMLIPVAGMMVVFGYLFRRFAREREGKPIEDFDFNSFGEYLKIGLWPVVSIFVVSLVIVPFAILIMLVVVFGAALLEEHEVLAIGLMIVGAILYIATITLFSLLMYPIMLRSGLMMDFKAGFSKSFVISFIRKVGLSLFGHYLLLMVVSIPLILLGYLALIIGAYVVTAWIQVVLVHLVFQHYDLFLERGGEAIAINPEVTRTFGIPPLPNLPQSGA
jgi:hypothetical protein